MTIYQLKKPRSLANLLIFLIAIIACSVNTVVAANSENKTEKNTENKTENKNNVNNKQQHKWQLRYSRSGGFAGISETISITNNGYIEIMDNIRNKTQIGFAKNKNDLKSILGQLKLIKKYYSNKNSKDKTTKITTKKIDLSKCRDCETSSMSFTIDKSSYFVNQDIKIAGKFIYDELVIKIRKLQKTFK